MGIRTWSQENIDFSRKVLNSGLDGARSGREAFLNGRSSSFLRESVRNAIKPAAIGAGIAVLSSCPGNRHRSLERILAFGLAGAALGFGVGMAWENRYLARSVGRSALRNIERAREEHWLESHPIDYA